MSNEELMLCPTCKAIAGELNTIVLPDKNQDGVVHLTCRNGHKFSFPVKGNEKFVLDMVRIVAG